jgi:two-component system, chemotaxis family, chemotaxis protein CheY
VFNRTLQKERIVNLTQPTLVVGATIDDCETTVSLLKTCGFRDITSATNTVDALMKLTRRRYGFIIADTDTEPWTGVELLRNVRGDRSMSDIYFVLMSRRRTPNDVMEAKRLGVDAFILKPMDAERLSEKLSILPKRSSSPGSQMRKLTKAFIKARVVPQDRNVRAIMKSIIDGAT